MDESSDEFLDWWEEPQSSCKANYEGSSPAMESHGASNIWKQSVELYMLRYTSMIFNCDSSTFKQLHDSKPYGAGHPVTKHECIGYVQKRMSTALRDKCKEKLVDRRDKQVRMKGKGRLTDKNIKKLTKYYGKAIESNIDDSAAMKEMLYGKYFTIRSPQIACHNTSFVPVGSDLGASIIVHLPSQSHHPTHQVRATTPLTHHPSRHCPSSVQDL